MDRHALVNKLITMASNAPEGDLDDLLLDLLANHLRGKQKLINVPILAEVFTNLFDPNNLGASIHSIVLS